MPEPKRHPFLVAFVITTLLLASAAPAAAACTALRQKDDKKKDDKSAAQKAAPPQSKQEREYQKIKQFSQKRYSENPEFRDEVDDAFRQKQREHSEYAFNINTLDQDRDQIIRTADRMRILDTLYDNPLAQDYVNRVGQSLVPSNSTHLYAFRITLSPIPEARSLSTGTVYVSTGLLAQIDNEAQLAYVLGHEIGHVERNHWFEDVLVEHGLDEYNEKQQQRRSIIGSIANVGTSVVSGGFIRGGNMMGLTASVLAQYSVPTLLKMAVPNAVVTWDKLQEDEADQLGLQYMLARNYDPREVPKFYQALQQSSRRDPRTGLGFMANAARVAERVSYISGLAGPALGGGMESMLLVGAINLNMQRQTDAMIQAAQPQPDAQPDTGKTMDPSRDAASRGAAMDKLIHGAMSAEIEEKLKAGQIIGSPAEFLAVMAELKRDNGIRAYYYDMFLVARDNLDESLQIRSNDPAAHFYYGKVLKLTGRTPGEKSRALSEFATAIDLDKRRMLPEAFLQRALTRVGSRDSAQTREIVGDLKDYVTLYQRQNGGQLPPNMDVIYDYMQDAGEMTWAATPAMNVSTKNIEPIGVAMGSAAARPAAPQVSQPAAQTEQNPAPPAKAQPRKRP
ncbi:MAG: beta-barrel assembly-enhancing protease [Acidobacteriota bacterium]|nr:beta-barrel assembly-enhancing protease [Acidobacteriota bacterium]